MDYRVHRSIEVMRSAVRDGQTVSPEAVARALNLSMSRFRHLFKHETGASPTAYLRSLRMRHAKQLIETTFLSVKQVMSGVGVNDISHFTRDFKRVYGK